MEPLPNTSFRHSGRTEQREAHGKCCPETGPNEEIPEEVVEGRIDCGPVPGLVGPVLATPIPAVFPAPFLGWSPV